MIEYWLRLKVAYRLFFKDALLNIIHENDIGFPKDEKSAYDILTVLRKKEESRLSHIITKAQWDTICHVCVGNPETSPSSPTCDDPCPKAGVSRIRTFDIPTMLAMIIGLSDLPPPKGSHGWIQELPRLGDGSRGAAVLLVKQLNVKMTDLSVRDVKNEDQSNELWDEMDILLTGLRYKNIAEFHKTRGAELMKYYKVVLKVVLDYYETVHQRLQQRNQKGGRPSSGTNSIITRLEFETLKEGIEHYLEDMDQSILGESAFESITRIDEYQRHIELHLVEDEERSQQSQSQNMSSIANDDGSNEDSEQMLTCVVEGMKLHISGNIEDEDSIHQQSQDLKDANKARFEMTVNDKFSDGENGSKRVKPTYTKSNLLIVTDQYFAKEYCYTSDSSFVTSVQNAVSKQKKFIQNEKKITNYKDIFTKLPECVVLVGNEGSGKSTLVHNILYNWGSGTLWGTKDSKNVSFDFVFVLHFRQLVRFENRPGITAEEILQHFYPNLPLDVLVLLKSEIKCLLILDGFDQFSAIHEFKKTSEEQSFYVKAVFNLLNPRNEELPFTRLITTHQRGLRYLANVSIIPTQQKNDKISLKIIELSGFTFQTVNIYYSQYFKDDPPLKELEDDIKNNKILYDMMTIPPICQGICELIDNGVMTDDKLPKTYTSLFTLLLVGRIWRRQFKSASSINGVLIKPVFKATCQNLASAAFHLEFQNKVTFHLEDLPNESNIHSLLESGFIIKLNDNSDQPNSYCYQFLHRIFHEFFIALHIFIHGFSKESKRVINKSILATLGGFCGAIVANTCADSNAQKFCKLFNSKLTMETILELTNGRDTEKMKTLHLFLKSLRDDPAPSKNKELSELLQSQKTSSSSNDVTTTTTSNDVKMTYDTSPAANALILYEFGFDNFREVTLSKSVSLTGAPLKSFLNDKINQTLKDLAKEKKIVFIGVNS